MTRYNLVFTFYTKETAVEKIRRLKAHRELFKKVVRDKVHRGFITITEEQALGFLMEKIKEDMRNNDVSGRVVIVQGIEDVKWEARESLARTYGAWDSDAEDFVVTYLKGFDSIMDPSVEDPDPEDDLVHYVRGSLRQSGYYRKRPFTYDLPSKHQRKARALFGRIAHDEGTDLTGKVEIVDKKGVEKEIPASAVPIMEKMKPVAPPKPVKVPTFVLQAERLRKIAEILARIPS